MPSCSIGSCNKAFCFGLAWWLEGRANQGDYYSFEREALWTLHCLCVMLENQSGMIMIIWRMVSVLLILMMEVMQRWWTSLKSLIQTNTTMDMQPRIIQQYHCLQGFIFSVMDNGASQIFRGEGVFSSIYCTIQEPGEMNFLLTCNSVHYCRRKQETYQG